MGSRNQPTRRVPKPTSLPGALGRPRGAGRWDRQAQTGRRVSSSSGFDRVATEEDRSEGRVCVPRRPAFPNSVRLPSYFLPSALSRAPTPSSPSPGAGAPCGPGALRHRPTDRTMKGFDHSVTRWPRREESQGFGPKSTALNVAHLGVVGLARGLLMGLRWDMEAFESGSGWRVEIETRLGVKCIIRLVVVLLVYEDWMSGPALSAHLGGLRGTGKKPPSSSSSKRGGPLLMLMLALLVDAPRRDAEAAVGGRLRSETVR